METLVSWSLLELTHKKNLKSFLITVDSQVLMIQKRFLIQVSFTKHELIGCLSHLKLSCRVCCLLYRKNINLYVDDEIRFKIAPTSKLEKGRGF